MVRQTSTIDTLVALQVSLFARGPFRGPAGRTGRMHPRVVGDAAIATLAPDAGPGPTSGTTSNSGPSRVTGGAVVGRLRRERARQCYAELRHAALRSLAGAVGEPTERGTATALWAFRQAWFDVANHPAGAQPRSDALQRAHAVCAAFAAQAEALAAQEADLRAHRISLIDRINAAADELAGLNVKIAGSGGAGVEATLARRDEIALLCAELIGARAAVNVLGQAALAVDGVALVTGAAAGRLIPAPTAEGGDAGARIGHSVRDAYGVQRDVDITGGRLGGVVDVLGHVLPTLMADLGRVAGLFADAVNDRHRRGFDTSGRRGAPVFDYDPADAAGTISVLLRDPAALAATAVAEQPLGTGNALALAAVNPAESRYQRLVGGLGAQVEQAGSEAADQRRATNQTVGCHDQCRGRSAVQQLATLRAHQRAFATAAVVLSTVETMLGDLAAGAASSTAGPARTEVPEAPREATATGTGGADVVPIRPPAPGGRGQHPSASPVAAVMVMRLRVSLAQQEQYLGNCADGLAWLAQSARCLADAQVCLNTVRRLGHTDEGATAGPAQRRTAAGQVRVARADLLRIANRTYDGRALFAGLAAGAQAYDSAATFVGTGGSVDRVVADESIVAVNVNGPDAFGHAPADAFSSLELLASALQDGQTAAVATGMRRIEADLERLRAASGDVRTRSAMVQAASALARSRRRSASASLAQLQAVALPAARAELVVQRGAHEAGLAACDLVAQPSLAVYLS